MHIVSLHSRYSNFDNSGENVVVNLQRNAFQELGCDVTYLILGDEIYSPKLIRRRFRQFLNFTFSFDAIRGIRNISKQRKIDLFLVHNTFPNMGIFLLWNLVRLKIPVVVVLHNFRYRCISGSHELKGSPCYKCKQSRFRIPGVINLCYRNGMWTTLAMYFYQLSFRHFLRKSQAVVVLSEYAKRELIESKLLQKARIHLIANGVKDRKQTLSRKARFENKCIFFAGRLESSKGIHLLLDAWENSPLRKQGWELVIAGSGSLHDLVIKRQSMDESIIFLGQLSNDEVLARLSCSTFFAIPSLGSENCPTGILEAYSLDIPVLGTDMGSIANMINESCGLLSSPDIHGWNSLFTQIQGMDFKIYNYFNPKLNWTSSYDIVRNTQSLVSLFSNILKRNSFMIK